MDPPATLSRDEFNRACQELLRRNPVESNDIENQYSDSFGTWTWSEPGMVSGWGHLKRTSSSAVSQKTPLEDTLDDSINVTEEDVVEAEDESCVPAIEPSNSTIYFHESIVWHPTYMVPAYYFQAVDSSGSPIQLDKVIGTNRFQRRTLLNTAVDVTTFGVQPRETNNAQFPLLSQGDHPILGTPHWYFHPCETSVEVKEILIQTLDTPWDPNNAECLLRWLKAWFAVLSTAIDLNR